MSRIFPVSSSTTIMLTATLYIEMCIRDRDMEYAEDRIGVDVGSVIKLTIGDQEIPVTVSGLFLNDGLKNGHGPLA